MTRAALSFAIALVACSESKEPITPRVDAAVEDTAATDAEVPETEADTAIAEVEAEVDAVVPTVGSPGTELEFAL